jgi:cell wall-associated NlpC family hydrolase
MFSATVSHPLKARSAFKRFATALLWRALAAITCCAVPVTAALAVDSLANGTSGSPAITPPSAMERIEKTMRKAVDGASEISSIALSLIGVDYKFGGNNPDQGLDCSGFVRYVFQQATGINLPRTSREQATVGQSVSKEQLQPGDLVFFNTRRFQFSHVGVYLGENRFVHSPSKGGSVEVVNLDNKYWTKAFNGARRVLGAVAGSPASAATKKPSSQTVATRTTVSPVAPVALTAPAAANMTNETSRSTTAHPPGGPAWVNSAGDY